MVLVLQEKLKDCDVSSLIFHGIFKNICDSVVLSISFIFYFAVNNKEPSVISLGFKWRIETNKYFKIKL